MKSKLGKGCLASLWLLIFNLPLVPVFGQGTAFTYQGRLDDAGSPAQGRYDLIFTLYNSGVAGASVAGPVTNAAVVITNGLFATAIDFGAGYLAGPDHWLEIAVRTNGAGAFVALVPRQPLLPAPYALFANTASNLSGRIPLSQLPAAVLTNNNAAGVALTGVFNGNGGGLTGLNASQLAGGVVPDGRLSANVALVNRAQTFSATNIFASGGAAGRLIVSNACTAVDTNLFTGLSLQYDATFGEGALMSSYNDGAAYLSFYTKPAGGLPLTEQMIIGAYGNVAIDQGNNNNGVFNDHSLAGAGLSFGLASGEGIASKRTVGGNQNGLDFYTDFVNRLAILKNGNVGIGVTNPAAKLEVNGDVRLDNKELYLTSSSTTNNGAGLGYRTGMPGIAGDGPFLYGFNGGALGGLSPTTIALSWDYHGNIWVSNNCSVATLSIRGGADLAEPFNITGDDGEVPPGAVVVIDEQNPGHLKLSDRPYDTHVVGVVSGANGVYPGIQMQQQGLIEGCRNVALTGRVYVQADAAGGAIRPGDCLTTSSTPGHAMKVADHERAAGAILGKAMTKLSEGKGLVLVLVSLQ